MWSPLHEDLAFAAACVRFHLHATRSGAAHLRCFSTVNVHGQVRRQPALVSKPQSGALEIQVEAVYSQLLLTVWLRQRATATSMWEQLRLASLVTAIACRRTSVEICEHQNFDWFVGMRRRAPLC